jgi:RimJ/RimL family protein N-acetyltransferase
MTNVRTITLETDRLILRPTTSDDWVAVRDFLMCEDTMRHLGGHQQESDAWRTLAQWIGLWSLTNAAMFGVIEKASGEWIGRIGPWYPLHWPTREVGWGLRKAYWGQGYAVEAASTSIDYAFDKLGWDSVTHLISDDNVASQALAERLGSTPGDTVRLPGSLSDVSLCVWSQTKAHWQSKRR